jgi:glycyl-tRNA synthetase beta subunit
MDKDARVKENRLSLLKMIDDYLLETADYSKIVLN